MSRDLPVVEYFQTTAPEDAKLRISTNPFEKKHIQYAVDALIEANDYNDENEEIQATLTKEVKSLVDALGTPQELYFMAIKTRVEDETVEEKRNVRIHAFTNIKNSKTVVIFTIEGSM